MFDMRARPRRRTSAALARACSMAVAARQNRPEFELLARALRQARYVELQP